MSKKRKITPQQQEILDFFYLFELNDCIKSLDDVFELAMADDDFKPTGYDYQIFRFIKQLLQKLDPGRRIQMDESSFCKKV